MAIGKGVDAYTKTRNYSQAIHVLCNNCFIAQFQLQAFFQKAPISDSSSITKGPSSSQSALHDPVLASGFELKLITMTKSTIKCMKEVNMLWMSIKLNYQTSSKTKLAYQHPWPVQEHTSQLNSSSVSSPVPEQKSWLIRTKLSAHFLVQLK